MGASTVGGIIGEKENDRLTLEKGYPMDEPLTITVESPDEQLEPPEDIKVLVKTDGADGRQGYDYDLSDSSKKEEAADQNEKEEEKKEANG